jgi:hypothetical protein
LAWLDALVTSVNLLIEPGKLWSAFIYTTEIRQMQKPVAFGTAGRAPMPGGVPGAGRP